MSGRALGVLPHIHTGCRSLEGATAVQSLHPPVQTHGARPQPASSRPARCVRECRGSGALTGEVSPLWKGGLGPGEVCPHFRAEGWLAGSTISHPGFQSFCGHVCQCSRQDELWVGGGARRGCEAPGSASASPRRCPAPTPQAVGTPRKSRASAPGRSPPTRSFRPRLC